MQTDKLGSFSWQSLGWIEMSVTVRGEDAHPSLPQEVSWSGSAGAGFGSDGWDGAVAGLLVGGRSPQPWGRGSRHPSPAWQSSTGRGMEEKPLWGWPRCGSSGWQKAGAAGTPGVPRACAGGSPAPSVSLPAPARPCAIN